VASPTLSMGSRTSSSNATVTRWRGVGHHLGAYGSIAPTGRAISYPGITIFRIAAGPYSPGLIAEAWVNADMAELLASLRAP
jgi:SnoaL-like polyketide cyclase